MNTTFQKYRWTWTDKPSSPPPSVEWRKGDNKMVEAFNQVRWEMRGVLI